MSDPVTRVLLLSSGRKGTWLMLTALGRRADCFAYPQIMSNPNYKPEATGEQILSSTLWRDMPDRKVVILPAEWYSGRKRHFGFWDCIKRYPLHIVHLHRHNMLRWYVSLQMALQTQRWQIKKSVDYPLPKITINIDTCQNRILEDLQHEANALNFFADNPTLHIWYEDLIRDFDPQMARLQRFFGLEPQQLQPDCHKQENRLLCQSIANYDELCRRWRNTPWARYLDDRLEPEVPPKPL